MIEAQTAKRGPGRPSQIKASDSSIKKGRASWKPASVLDVVNKEDGFRYRWAHKSAENLARKEAEGWETVSKLQSDNATHVSTGRMNDGAPLTTTHERHDCVLQRIPEEVAQERDAYFDDINSRRISGLTAHLKKDIRDAGGTPHGEITISSRKGTQVYE